MEPEQQQRFRDAVDRKSAEAEEASHHPGEKPDDGDPVTPHQDAPSARAKNQGKGKKTADKWNQ